LSRHHLVVQSEQLPVLNPNCLQAVDSLHEIVGTGTELPTRCGDAINSELKGHIAYVIWMTTIDNEGDPSNPCLPLKHLRREVVDFPVN